MAKAFEAVGCPLSVAVHLLTAVLLTQALLFGYRHWYGHLAHEPAEYLSRDGFFLAADMAPIIKPVDFPVAGKRAQVFGSLRFPLSDPDARRVQRWVEGGICQAILHSADNNEDEANRLARKTALRAIKRNPLGLLKLGALTYWEFFRYDQLKWALELNQGQFVDPVSQRRTLHTEQLRHRHVTSQVQFAYQALGEHRSALVLAFGDPAAYLFCLPCDTVAAYTGG